MLKSFTLIELIVVIVIIAVLAAVLTPVAIQILEKGKVARILALADTIKKACEMYYADTGRYAFETSKEPPEQALAHMLSSNPGGIPEWDGPYISKPLTDFDNPFNDLVYVSSSQMDFIFVIGAVYFDLDSNGEHELRWLANILFFDSVPEGVARKVNNAIDGADDSGWGPDDWKSRGRVEIMDSGEDTLLMIYLMGEKM